MADDTILRGLMQSALFVASIFLLYEYTLWAKRCGSLISSTPELPPNKYAVENRGILFASQRLASPVGSPGRKGASNAKWATLGDWIVPVIVWLLVIMMTLAIVAFLLGDR